MKHRILTTLLCLIALCATPVRARLIDSRSAALDSLRVSLLTVAAGPEVYERFGHSAIRIQGVPGSRTGEPVVVGYAHGQALELPYYPNLPRQNDDLVFHYGVFSFNEPNFIYRFVKGETDYSIGCLPYDRMLHDYEGRGLRVIEQHLDLTSAEAKALLHRLLVNNLPCNRKYRYNFFFDNCATRPYHLMQAATDSIHHPIEAGDSATTLRDMLRQKTGRNTWLDFGISLVIAGRADLPTTFDERMFLPEYLMEAYARATVLHGDSLSPLVLATDTVVDGNPLIRARLEQPQTPWTSPTACAWALLLVVVGLTVVQIRRGGTMHWLDCLLLAAAGLTGVMVWFLNFCSDHPAVDHNWNCLWLVPTHLLFAVLIWIKSCKKVVDFYFFITFVALFVYLGAALMSTQFVHPAFIPIVLALAVRAGVGSGVIKLTSRHTR